MRFFRAVLRILQPLSPALAAWLAERLFFTAPRRALTPAARAFLATGRRFTLAVAGRRIVAWHWGDVRQAPVVYLSHGWASRGARVAPLARALLRAGHAGGPHPAARPVRRAPARCRLRGRHLRRARQRRVGARSDVDARLRPSLVGRRGARRRGSNPARGDRALDGLLGDGARAVVGSRSRSTRLPRPRRRSTVPAPAPRPRARAASRRRGADARAQRAPPGRPLGRSARVRHRAPAGAASPAPYRARQARRDGGLERGSGDRRSE